MPLPEEPPAPRPGPTALRVAAHALWIGPVTTAVALTIGSTLVVATDHDPDFPGVMGALWLTAIALVVGLPISLLCSGAAGLAAGGVARALCGARAPLAVSALVGGLAATAAVGLPLVVLTTWPLGVPVLAICAVTGALSVLVAGRRQATRPHAPDDVATPRRGGVWLAAATTAGLATWTALLWSWVENGFALEPTELCASRLGVTESRTVYVGGQGFPPRSWCLAGDRVERLGTPWLAVVTVGLLVAGVGCALIWLVRRFGLARGASGRWAFGLVLAAVGVLGGWWALATDAAEPPAQARAQAAERDAQADTAEAEAAAAARIPAPGATSSPSPTPAPAPVSLDLARAELAVLQAQAQDVGGPSLLWQQPMAITEAPCADVVGGPGTALELYGRFTTRDLATASDNVDFLLITQANEDVAEAIVRAWNGGGVDGVDVMRGEYWLTPEATSTVASAHVGFDQGVGEVRVTTACAVSESGRPR
ncbi:hypothetical protein [Xylanimonas ulmi]|uniref:Uncharacterized protein n=1 Tax=Xylanimonas ulmi TaxID=228973 RepID=A0A4Q7LYN6_9MICO|nr:hypothetical protein [Xylanibacterium ulmi]RZS60395.1 hypothetical protein EV386_0650 [Xylanibacterium ulmi]